MRVAVIPARGGSKRIPHKNIREFHGRPMIAWSIEAAIKSGCFDRIVVSTDDIEIAEVAKKNRAEVPFVRPAILSDDHTPTIPVIQHAIDELGLSLGDEICCIYATAPFMRPSDVAAGICKLTETGSSHVFPVTTFPFPIQRGLRLSLDGHVEMINPELFSTRSQDLDEAWHDAGQFYWAKAQIWTSGAPIFSPKSFGLRIPRHLVQDIDTEEDWVRAEMMMTLIKDGKRA